MKKYLVFVPAVLLIGALATGVLVAAEPDTSRPVGKELFTIGQEDKSQYEFCLEGFRGEPEYTCRVEADYAAEAFPRWLYRAPIPSYADDGVERITIIFTLDHDYNEVVLRLVRAGAETAVVTVDGKRTHLVTNSMLESNEGYIFGAYNLTLGALNKGTHTIQLTLADDGTGNDMHVWDAIALFAR